MKRFSYGLAFLLAAAPVAAAEKGKPIPPKAAAPPRATPTPTPAQSVPAKPPKAKVYTFTGLDVEGKLKAPQLLYFLNRVKLELDTTSPEKRSFMKELEKSSDDKGL